MKCKPQYEKYWLLKYPHHFPIQGHDMIIKSRDLRLKIFRWNEYVLLSDKILFKTQAHLDLFRILMS